MVTPEITAVLPFHGPVDWPASAVDSKAKEWLGQHRPTKSASWLSIVTRDDTRRCAGCPNALWQSCQYALWARFWQATRAANGVRLGELATK